MQFLLWAIRNSISVDKPYGWNLYSSSSVNDPRPSSTFLIRCALFFKDFFPNSFSLEETFKKLESEYLSDRLFLFLPVFIYRFECFVRNFMKWRFKCCRQNLHDELKPNDRDLPRKRGVENLISVPEDFQTWKIWNIFY